MNQSEFSIVKNGDSVLTAYKGHIVKMIVVSIHDAGRQKRSVNLRVPNSDKIILRHMYNIYTVDKEV